MKKFLLLVAAVASLSMSAQNYTFEKIWEVTEGLPTNADARQGISVNGVYYINVKGADNFVQAVTAEGIKATTIPGGTNCGISRDEAGNLIISTAVFPNGWTCDGEAKMIRVVDPATGKSVEYAINEDGAVAGRADFLGLAKGNMMETGELYLVGATNAGVVRMNVVDGELDEDNTFEATCSGLTPSTSTVVNYFKNAAGEDRALYVTRNAAPQILTGDENFEGTALTLPNKGASNGAQLFVFDGKEYAVYPTLPNYEDGFAIALVGAEEAAYTVENTGKTAYAQCDWVNAEVDGEGNVTIYQYLPGIAVRAYKLSKPATAVENVNAGKTVAGVKYVNLAGQVSSEAFDGVNVVVTTYTDGSQNAVKVVK